MVFIALFGLFKSYCIDVRKKEGRGSEKQSPIVFMPLTCCLFAFFTFLKPERPTLGALGDTQVEVFRRLEGKTFVCQLSRAWWRTLFSTCFSPALSGVSCSGNMAGSQVSVGPPATCMTLDKLCVSLDVST